MFDEATNNEIKENLDFLRTYTRILEQTSFTCSSRLVELEKFANNQIVLIQKRLDYIETVLSNLEKFVKKSDSGYNGFSV